MASQRHAPRSGTRIRFLAAAALAAALASPLAAAAQETPFGGFAHDSNQPIEVAADTLEVRNADQMAVFRGDVDVRQGGVRMRSTELEVFYADRATASDAEASSPQPGGGSIDRLRARGEVIITNGAETARSNNADYDVAGGEILLTGDVILLQGENVIKGERLRIDLATGQARIEGAASQPRIQMRLSPEDAQQQ